MGSNSLQAQGVVVFLSGGILLAGSLAAGGNLLLLLGALTALAISSGIFLKCRGQEHRED